MLKTNQGTIDRAIRIIIGLALVAAFFVDTDASYRWAYLLGLIPLATGLIGSCPAYSMLGISTCPMKRR
jgi:hypothetical protein